MYVQKEFTKQIFCWSYVRTGARNSPYRDIFVA